MPPFARSLLRTAVFRQRPSRSTVKGYGCWEQYEIAPGRIRRHHLGPIENRERILGDAGVLIRFDPDLGPAIQTLRMYFDEACIWLPTFAVVEIVRPDLARTNAFADDRIRFGLNGRNRYIDKACEPLRAIALPALESGVLVTDQAKFIDIRGKGLPVWVDAWFNQFNVFVMVSPRYRIRRGRRVVGWRFRRREVARVR